MQKTRKKDLTALNPAVYREPMPVTEMIVRATFYGKNGYYLCPRCGTPMERLFTAFCDRCGQRLDWHDYRKAAVVEAEHIVSHDRI